MIRKYHNHKPQTSPQHREEEPPNHHETPGRQRTSDSLNEGLPLKMTREKFQRKWYFSYEKDSRFNPRLIHKSRFLIGKVPIEKYRWKTQFLLFNIQKIEKVLLKCSPPHPRDQTNPLAYKCIFTFHTSYKNGKIGHGGNAVKMLKTL